MLPSASRQQNVTEYEWECSVPTAPPPPFASDVVGQHRKRGDITYGAVLLH